MTLNSQFAILFKYKCLTCDLSSLTMPNSELQVVEGEIGKEIEEFEKALFGH